MRLSLIILVFPFVLSAAIVPSDSTAKKPGKFPLNGVYLNAGLFITPSMRMNSTELGNVWSDFSAQPYANYKESPYAGSGYTGNSCFEAGASFYTNFGKTDSLHNRWQTSIGFTYLSQQSTISSFEKYTTVRADTLNSMGGGATYYKDLVYYNSVYVSYASDFIGLNLCETFTSDFNKFFSMTGGIGLSAMTSINTRIQETNGVWIGENLTTDPYFNYDSAKVSVANYEFFPSDRSIASSNRNMFYSLYLTGGFNVKWVSSKKGVHLILNPMVRGGVKDLSLGAGGNYFNAFVQPCINLRVVFR
jgi:hypothetical protein